MSHPQSSKISTVNPGGTSTTRDELAGCVAALINKHTRIETDSAPFVIARTHIAMDNAGSLWQIRNSIF